MEGDGGTSQHFYSNARSAAAIAKVNALGTLAKITELGTSCCLSIGHDPPSNSFLLIAPRGNCKRYQQPCSLAIKLRNELGSRKIEAIDSSSFIEILQIYTTIKCAFFFLIKS